jgi:hypothetical protein
MRRCKARRLVFEKGQGVMASGASSGPVSSVFDAGISHILSLCAMPPRWRVVLMLCPCREHVPKGLEQHVRDGDEALLLACRAERWILT